MNTKEMLSGIKKVTVDMIAIIEDAEKKVRHPGDTVGLVKDLFFIRRRFKEMLAESMSYRERWIEEDQAEIDVIAKKAAEDAVREHKDKYLGKGQTKKEKKK